MLLPAELFLVFVPALTGVTVTLLVWLLLTRLTCGAPGGVSDPAAVTTHRRVPLLFKAFMPLARNVAPFFRRQDFEGLRSRTDARLVQAGYEQQFSPEEFLGLRLIYVIVFVVLGSLFFAFQTRAMSICGILLVVLGLLYPIAWLTGEVRRRHRAIQRALPNVLDLMTLSVEAGRDFLSALHEILLNRPSDPLGEELERVFREVQLGKQRRQSLRNMSARVQQADLTMVVETLAQADELGVSIGQILRILGDQMRQKRFQLAEKLGNEAPVKLLLPLFLFIFPAVIIVMLGPILMRSLNMFSQ